MQVPFHESVLRLLKEPPGGMTSAGFILLCHLIETTKLPELHEEIEDELEKTAQARGWEHISCYNSAIRALQLGALEEMMED